MKPLIWYHWLYLVVPESHRQKDEGRQSQNGVPRVFGVRFQEPTANLKWGQVQLCRQFWRGGLEPEESGHSTLRGRGKHSL